MGGLYYDTGSIEFIAIHSTDSIICITLIIIFHKGISMFQVNSINLTILCETVFQISLTGTCGELANVDSSISTSTSTSTGAHDLNDIYYYKERKKETKKEME